MNALTYREFRNALSHGLLAGLLILVVNGIGHYGFGAPEIPYAYGVAAALTAVVTAIRLYVQLHDTSRTGF